RLFAVSPVENEVSKYYLTSGEPEIPGEIECAVMDIPGNKTRRGGNSIACQNQNYQNWSFRLFVACTGEFGNHLGSKPNSSLAIVRLVSHMNSFYTNEMGIHFTLVLYDRFIYTDSSEDPFSPESSSPNLAEQARRFFRDSVDAGLYDLGHVMHKLSTSSGNLLGSGIAYLRSLCDGTYKGGGWTGTSHPGNLNFTLNILGHEIGHQLGADHSFYGSLGNCSGTNRSAANGFEPGAGSTMMSYESNCGSHNLHGPPSQFFYFNTHSYNQILQFINVQNCGNRTGSASIPSVQIPGNFSVPINTAFDLTANASGSYLFNWEQYDTDGGSGHSHPIDGGKYQGTPMYRSYDPSGTGYHRSFPAKEVQRGSPYNGEVWATVARDITLRLTTRNGGTIRCDEMTVTVRNAPAFKILEPLRNAVIDLAETPTRANSETMTVRWETGDTETNGFPTIDILYSIDGGVSFPYLLADNVPNTGEYEVRPPEIETGQARLKILL